MLTLENILPPQTIQKIGWMLLHFTWQATTVAIVLAVMLRILRRFSANLRYIVACFALGLIVLMPIITIQFINVSSQPLPLTIAPATEIPVVPMELTAETPLGRQLELNNFLRAEPVDPKSKIDFKQQAITFLEPKLPYIVTVWLLGVFALSVWHLGGWAQLQKLRKKMVKPLDASINDKLSVLTNKLGIRQAVGLLESALVQIPTVVGWIKPVILLPASAMTGLTTEQLQAILAHELAHIKRFDYLVNILQTIVEILGFYHPAVWWVSHKIRVEREHCCDDMAVVLCGDKINYAKALTSLEELRSTGQLAVAATGGNLFSRIRRLLGKNSSEKSLLSWIPAVVVILLLIALAIPTTLAIATRADLQQTDDKQGWGEAMEGVQVQLQADIIKWKEGEVLKLKAEVRNNGVRELAGIVREIIVDGQLYLTSDGIRSRSFQVGPTEKYDDVEVTLDDRWYSQEAYKGLRLSQGKHTIQITSEFQTGLEEPETTPVIVTSNQVEIEILPNEDKNGIIAANENLEVLGINFAPIHQGKNEVYIKIRNRTDKEQIFNANIFGTSNNHTQVVDNTEIIQPNTTNTVKLVYRLREPVNNDNTQVFMVFLNPLTQDSSQGEYFYIGRFYSGDLERSIDEILDAVATADQTQTQAVQEAFREIQNNIRNKEYEKAWNLFTEDYKKAGFSSTAIDKGFELFKQAMEVSNSSANTIAWDKYEFLNLQPGIVSYLDGIFYLSADYNQQNWVVHFKIEDNRYKIDWIDGYTPGYKIREIEQRALSAENLSDNVFKIVNSPANELIRICFNINSLEPGQYVEIKDTGKREFNLPQVTTSSIGKSGEDFPAYACYIDFEIRSNFDLNLTTQRITRGELFEHDKWDAYFTGPDSFIGNGTFSTTTLCVSTWRQDVFAKPPGYTVDETSLVTVTIKPDSEQDNTNQIGPPANEFIINSSVNAQPDDIAEESTQEPGDAGETAVQIETRFLYVNEEFIEEIGLKLDPNTVGVLDDLQATFVLRASPAAEGTKIIVAPRVTVLNNESAQFFNGQMIPVLTGFTEPNNPSEEAKPIYERKSIGTTTELTPHVSIDKENIHLDFYLEISQLSGYEERIFNGKYKEKVRQIETKAITTTKAIPDNKTLLLDGGSITLYDENESGFKQEQKRLLILAKPTIILPEKTETLSGNNNTSAGFFMANIENQVQPTSEVTANTQTFTPLISSRYKNEELVMVLNDLSEEAGVPILFEDTLNGIITCEVENKTLDQALEMILAGTPYVLQKTSDYYLVIDPSRKNTDVETEQSNGESSEIQPEEQTKILIDTMIANVSDEFLEYAGLDTNSLESSDTWSKYRVEDSNESNIFVIDLLVTDLLLKQIQDRKNCAITSKPQLLALVGEQASFQIITEEYFAKKPEDKIDVSEENFFSKIKEEVDKGDLELFQAGTLFEATPTVRKDNKIQLDLEVKINKFNEHRKNELPELVSLLENTSSTLIPENQTLLIVGKKFIETTSEKSKVTVIGDLPIVSGLFTNQNETTEEQSLLIFIKPTIITDETMIPPFLRKLDLPVTKQSTN